MVASRRFGLVCPHLLIGVLSGESSARRVTSNHPKRNTAINSDSKRMAVQVGSLHVHFLSDSFYLLTRRLSSHWATQIPLAVHEFGCDKRFSSQHPEPVRRLCESVMSHRGLVIVVCTGLQKCLKRGRTCIGTRATAARRATSQMRFTSCQVLSEVTRMLGWRRDVL